MAFQIKPNRKETENKTIRFPIPLIDNIEKAIQGQDVTFSRFVIQACEYALNNLEDSKSKGSK
ncbi:MAG: YlcI/YnfO family protein [Clostridia bacterium]